MNSTQAVDLHDVDAYWKSRNLVDDRHRPYCLRWLQRFMSGPCGAGRLAPNDALAAFAQHLGQDNRAEEWQVRQAVRSVELFYHDLHACDQGVGQHSGKPAGSAGVRGGGRI
jgi:hypothetical protein